MKSLAIAAGAVLFVNAVLPCVDGFSVWIQNIFNVQNTKLVKQAAEYQAEPASNVNAIGFSMDSTEYISEEEDD